MLVLRVAELVLITVITVLLIRAPGKKIHTSICLDWWTQSVSLQLKCYSVLYFPGNQRPVRRSGAAASQVKIRSDRSITVTVWDGALRFSYFLCLMWVSDVRVCQSDSLFVLFHRWIMMKMKMMVWWNMKTVETLLPLSDSTDQQLPHQHQVIREKTPLQLNNITFTPKSQKIIFSFGLIVFDLIHQCEKCVCVFSVLTQDSLVQISIAWPPPPKKERTCMF